MPRLAVIAALWLGLLAQAGHLHAGAGLAPGQPAPAVSVRSADGQPVSLASFKGKVVLLDFWASWCGPCAASFPALEDLFQEYRSRGFDVVAVNLDEKREDADRFLADRPHAMTVVFDPQGQSARAFGLQGMPTSVLIDRDGTVRFLHTGYSPATLDSYRKEIEQLLEERR